MGLKIQGVFPFFARFQLLGVSSQQSLYLKGKDAHKTQNSTSKEQCLYWPPHNHQQRWHEHHQQPHLITVHLGSTEFLPPLLQNQAQISFRSPEQRGRSSFGFIVVAVVILFVLFFQAKYQQEFFSFVIGCVFYKSPLNCRLFCFPHTWKPAARSVRWGEKTHKSCGDYGDGAMGTPVIGV